MQCPPTKPGLNGRKFHLVPAASKTSSVSIWSLLKIKESSFIVANDTGPAHIAAHVGAKGLTLFGKHTSAYKVNIERENFRAIEVSDLNNLSAGKVFERLTNLL